MLSIPVAALSSTLLLLNGLPSASAQTVPSSNCSTGLHIIVARASGEPQGEGIIGATAKNITGMIPGSDSVAVVYPSTLQNYVNSETAGQIAMNQLIREYVASCPNSKYALMGYSQGAQVVGDVLCGTSEPGWNMTSPLPANLSANFIGSVQMGDPTFLPNQPQDKGTATQHGTFVRQNPSGCAPYYSRMASYCNEGDFFCANGRGKDAIPIHLSYVSNDGGAATAFLVNQYRMLSGNSTTPSNGTMGANSTSTSTAAVGGGLSSSMSSLASHMSTAMSGMASTPTMSATSSGSMATSTASGGSTASMTMGPATTSLTPATGGAGHVSPGAWGVVAGFGMAAAAYAI